MASNEIYLVISVRLDGKVIVKAFQAYGPALKHYHGINRNRHPSIEIRTERVLVG